MSLLSRKCRSFKRRHRLLRRTAASPISLVWWGSFEGGGGATVGDLHAVENLSAALRRAGHDHQVLSHPALGIVDHCQVRDLFDVRREIETLVFVCGPIVQTDELVDLLAVHRKARKLAVGVSVISRHRQMAARFEAVLARDGLSRQSFDLAISRSLPCAAPEPGKRLKAGLCLRGDQRDYGDGMTEWAKAERLLLQLAETFGLDTEPIDTVLRPGNEATKIEQQFETVDLVLTTRLHGSLYGLSKGKPVIAIDQIKGTGKVKPILDRIGWPLAYSIEEANEALLAYQMRQVLTEWPVEMVTSSQATILDLSSMARADAVALIGRNKG
ncbi:MAG: polysaccharide pyruvyl transferase family protein [Mesorhizobium sp.]|uniref:polysaccharide pyruvyl transferase family protein n=1 Tax=unclassified Mesorhizobium TaxID=325217 RepID=UPI000FCAC536|nr:MULTISPECIES: polysaccharide pyruvyl transferase family protein [unclassified Mesorhizobium]RUV42481.1 polysaccharide pyruvyl transferase family protein [Mesorhizobium sp. M1A.T.Ca.IN.004.03.1.1]RWG21863.1 MAG: polysaccharide pyruvyl transferase family protein [Mesorhizobium sp.]RWI90214.1 MAG: polysaccharide pyruvyl transferase family protein [Mesorhizobium sp.]RWI97283.1 MAG: polysaccharide pyruvyl transferase family protein [Mesorhizobium sp.]RWK38807.1 MAG: polysaccharide pyruvyl transf